MPQQTKEAKQPETGLVNPELDQEITRTLQEAQTENEPDPLMDAIQQELGQKLAPAELHNAQIINAETLFDDPVSEKEIFRVTNLTKAYGSGAAYVEVIKGISFNVQEGEFVVVYGPSGSGKSTLLYLLAGLEIPSRGEIKIRNQRITEFTDDELALYHREEIGLVFQSFNLLESLTVWENVAFPLMLAGAPVEWRRHEALKMLDKFGMADFSGYYPSQLSGGQQQRVSLARALIHDPALLLVDEPTGNLDSKSADTVLKEIDRLHKQDGRTIILVTHSQTFLPYATRVFYIKDGTLLTTNEQSRLDSPERSPAPGVGLASS